MKKNLLWVYLMVICILAGNNNAQTVLSCYEGMIDEYPVWFELSIDEGSPIVTGSYFYKKVGTPMVIDGNKNGNLIILNEKNNKGVVTGIFELTIEKKKITGVWKKPKGGAPLKVNLNESEMIYKACSKIPSADKLILSDGATLGALLDQSVVESEESGMQGNTGSNQKNRPKRPKLSISYAQKCIITLGFITAWGPFNKYESLKQYVFNSTTCQEIILNNEIDPSKWADFQKFLIDFKQEKLIEHEKNWTREEWQEAYGVEDDSYKLAFKVEELFETENIPFYINSEGKIIIEMEDYLGLSMAAMSMTWGDTVEVPFSYLLPNSILQRLKN